MFCVYCRTPFEENDKKKFCAGCGRELHRDTTAAPAEQKPELPVRPPQKIPAQGLTYNCVHCRAAFPVICTECGKQVSDSKTPVPKEGWMVCAECGQSFWVICPHCESTQQQQQYPVQTPQKQIPQQQHIRSKKRMGMAVLFALPVLTFIIGIGIAFFTGSGDKAPNINHSPSEQGTPSAQAPSSTPSAGNDTPSNQSGSNQSSMEIGAQIDFAGEQWRVLAIEDGKALIISRTVLFTRAYHSQQEIVTWEESEIRQYLNGEFFDETFSAEEKAQIVESRLITADNGSRAGGNDTDDKVFLLSIEEVEKYMENKNGRTATFNGGAYTWLLRSPGTGGTNVTVVITTGDIDGGAYRATANGVGIRPAIWITVQGG